MSKMSVSKYIETSEDGEKLIFDVDETSASGEATDISATIAALESRIEALEAAVEALETAETTPGE